MDSQKWQQIKAVFEEVVDIPLAERQMELNRLTASDLEIRKEVESLLEFDSHKQVICTSTTPLPGNCSGAIVGPYRLNFPLAINEKTEVWQATHTKLSADSPDRRVAIKFFKDLTGDERRERRFKQEAAILSRFEHPGIARYLDEGETESGVPWFSTAYVEGENLLAMANKQGLDLKQRLSLFDQVCSAIEYSHRFLVVHRDLKPANIVVDETGKAVLIDFGISKQIEQSPIDADYLTRTYERTLTPAYASPEQLRGEPVSAVTDVYGAGLVLYELVCGHHPYSDSVHKPNKPLFDRILFEMPLAPSNAIGTIVSGLTGISSEFSEVDSSTRLDKSRSRVQLKLENRLDQIVLRALSKSPDHRQTSIAELRRELKDFCDGKSVGKAKSTTATLTFFQRNSMLSMLSTAVVGAAMTFGCLQLFKTSDDKSLADQIRILESLNGQAIDFNSPSIAKWKSSSTGTKLALLERATNQYCFEDSLEIAADLNENSPTLTTKNKFRLARQWDELGFPGKALSVLEITPKSFEGEVADNPSLESFRIFYCRLLIEMGRPSTARAINEAGPSSSTRDQFERELVENEVRAYSLWFDGIEDRLESAKPLLTDAMIGEESRHRFAELEYRFTATEEQLRRYAIGAQDSPGHWSKSKVQLELAKKLLKRKQRDQGKAFLLEVIQTFEKKDLPRHPIVMSSLIVADQFEIQEIDVAEWWTRHGEKIELDNPIALELFATVAKWRRDPTKEYGIIKPWLARIIPIENAFIKSAAMRDVWQSVLSDNNQSTAALVTDLFKNAAHQSADQNSFQHAEALVIASTIERAFGFQDSSVERERFESCKEILTKTKEENADNAATAFLHAIDCSSAESLFQTPSDNETKSAADWMREFANHRNNPASDQLEMTAWFSENHVTSNKEDVGRMIEFVRRLRLKKKWGPKGETNWSRIDSIAKQISD